LATSIVLYGVESSFSPEFVESARRASVIIAGAIIAGEPEWDMEGLPVEPAHHLDVALRTIEFVIPWVTPGIRFRRWQQACAAGLAQFGSLIDPTAVMANSVRLGAGAYVNCASSIGACVTIGDGALLNRQASIGHHSVLGRFVSVGPGATVASNCRVGNGVMLGAAAVLAPDVSIGDNAVIAVGAVVAKDVPANCIVAGNPARIVRREIAGYKDVAVV
jgi:sugar O-acyltransferase (sialic acid O-acetyltransferase NeuD family)